MSQYSPDLFKPARASEALLKMAEEKIDALGGNYAHLKKELRESLETTDAPKPPIIDPSKGLY